MGDGEYNNLKFYMRNNGTGEPVELGEVKEIDMTTYEEAQEMHNISLWKFEGGSSFSFVLTQREVIQFKQRFFPETLNNYRKLHGMPLIRKRWHG